MDLSALRDVLATLKDAGVRRAKLDGYALAEVEFEPPQPGPTRIGPAITDSEGNPLDLDADMPPLGRDLVAEANLNRKDS